MVLKMAKQPLYYGLDNKGFYTVGLISNSTYHTSATNICYNTNLIQDTLDWKSDDNTKDWYLYSAETGFVYNTNEKINVVLGGVEPALLYKGGQAYYHTTIKHLGNPGTNAEFGVVRNHSYIVNITKITGFGTPVYNPNTQVGPETPVDFTTYVAADVRILSWRVVDADYEL